MGEGDGTPSSTLAWKIPWTEEPGGLQSTGSRRVGHDWETSLSLSCIGEGNGNPLQCSCLENPRDGGAWWAAVYGVPQSQDTTEATSNSMGTYSKEVQWIVCHARSPRWGYFKRGFKDKLELIERMEKGRRKRNIWDERLLESPKAGWIRCLERKERRKESLSGARAKWSGRKVAEDGAEKIDGWGQIDTGPCGPL